MLFKVMQTFFLPCHLRTSSEGNSAADLELECTYTLRLWFFAIAEAGSQDCGFTWIAFIATFLQNRLCQRESSVSVNIPFAEYSIRAISCIHHIMCRG